MSKITKGWTAERRAKQAENMKKTKPWLQTTGPRTADGKDAIKNNALKHGGRSMAYRRLLDALKAQENFLKSLDLGA